MSTNLKESAAKDFVARKACTLKLSKARGTHWNMIKYKERLGNCWQATINLDLWARKSLEDYLPKLYCVDLVEAYVMQESAHSMILCEKKTFDLQSPMDVCTRNFRQKAEMGTKTCTESTTRFPRASCFKKSMHSVPETWGGMYNVLPQSAKVWENGTRNWIPRQPRKVQRN